MARAAAKKAPTPAPAPEESGVREPRLAELSQPTRRDRWAESTNFGGIDPPRMAAVLRSVEAGYLQDWADLKDWMLDTDAHLASTYETRLTRAAMVDLEVVPGQSPDPIAQSFAEVAADFVSECWEALRNRTRVLRNMADAIGAGVSVGEKMYTRRSGAAGGWYISEVRWRHLRRFRFGEQWELRLYDGGLRGQWGEALDPDKYLVHMPQVAAGYPTKTGVLRKVTWTWLFKQWMRKFAVQAAESWGHPIPIGKTPAASASETRTALKKALQNISSGQAGVVDKDVELMLLEAANGDGGAYTTLIDMLNAEESKAILGSVDNVEHTGTGTYASALSQADVTIDPRTQSDIEDITDTLDHGFVKSLIGFNLHLFGRRWPALPQFRPRERSGAPADLQPHHLDGRVKVRQNEVRASLNLPSLTKEEGGEEFVQPAPATGGMPFSQQLAGGEPAAAPLPTTSAPATSSSPPTSTSPTSTRPTTRGASASTSRSAARAPSPPRRRSPL